MSDSVSGADVENFDDVEEFLSVNNSAAAGVPLERFQRVYGLMQKGNRAFRENKIEEAIAFYSEARNLKPGDPVILSNRCLAFCRMSQFLKNRSTSASEHQPLNGLDPITHAEVALKDAEKLLKIGRNSTKSYYLKAHALILLERYEKARETLLSGLQINPLSIPLKASFLNLERENLSYGSVTIRKCRTPQRSDDFDCTLCMKLLYEPVTTPCGHTFCRSCLFQCMDHGNKCPMCRKVLFITLKTCCISVTLNNIIQKSFPEEYAERKLEYESLINLGVDLIPLFVMDVVLPCQKLSLNIFEPRYRLMIRRIMEGNHRMGMAVIDSATGSIAEYACEVEISECEPLTDGRFLIEIEGRRRFRILRSWDQDGYRVAEVEWINDICPPIGTREREDLKKMVLSAAEFALSWIRGAKDAARRGRRWARIDQIRADEIPGPEDPERFSFWLVSLLNSSPSDKLELLQLRDTRERITHGLALLRAAEQGCQIQ